MFAFLFKACVRNDIHMLESFSRGFLYWFVFNHICLVENVHIAFECINSYSYFMRKSLAAQLDPVNFIEVKLSQKWLLVLESYIYCWNAPEGCSDISKSHYQMMQTTR